MWSKGGIRHLRIMILKKFRSENFQNSSISHSTGRGFHGHTSKGWDNSVNNHGQYRCRSVWSIPSRNSNFGVSASVQKLVIRGARGPRRSHNFNSKPLNPNSPDLIVERFPPLPNKFSMSDKVHYIVKPIVFTAFVGCGSSIGCTIWQYEDYKKQVAASGGRFSFSNWRIPAFGTNGCENGQNQSKSEMRKQFDCWWDSLSPGEKVFWPICALNTLVFCAWRLPNIAPSMVTYFSATPVSRAICWPMLLSTFSHYSFFHLAANMFVLHSFIPAAAQILGKEQFVAMYLTSGVVASLGSHLHKLFLGSTVPSLGASGAIMGILGLVCTRMPDIQLGIIFLPGVQFTAETALKCIVAVDVVGLIGGWRFFDHAAHLAGCLFGIGFSCYGANAYWSFRDFVMTTWHKIRERSISS